MKITKKFISLAVLFVLVAAVSSAEIAKNRFKITENPAEFTVDYIVTPDMTLVDSKENNDVAVTRTYSVKKGKEEGEIRYSLFTDIGEPDGKEKMQAYIWSLMCTMNMAGYEFPQKNLTPYGDNDVKGEFNGDYGFNAFIRQPKSEYADGFNYIYADFFYKKGQGLVIRAFLFKDISFVGLNPDGSVKPNSALFSNYDSFRFYDSKEAYPQN